jgi:hypothetical protein
MIDRKRKEEPRSVMLVEYVCDILYGSDSSCDELEYRDFDSGRIAELIEISQVMELNLANAAFCAGRGLVGDVASMHAPLPLKEPQAFDGIIVDSRANKS